MVRTFLKTQNGCTWAELNYWREQMHPGKAVSGFWRPGLSLQTNSDPERSFGNGIQTSWKPGIKNGKKNVCLKCDLKRQNLMTSNFLETNKLCLKKKAKAKETTFTLKWVKSAFSGNREHTKKWCLNLRNFCKVFVTESWQHFWRRIFLKQNNLCLRNQTNNFCLNMCFFGEFWVTFITFS